MKIIMSVCNRNYVISDFTITLVFTLLNNHYFISISILFIYDVSIKMWLILICLKTAHFNNGI